jgi:D-tyrosyl-tRNA(Tyr) deacylase
MRALVQRVAEASVTVMGESGSEVVGSIGPGLLALVGITHSDTAQMVPRLAAKIWNLRVLDDEAGVMNRSLSDVSADGGSVSVLVVSQFTLYGDTTAGRRPSWIAAARPEQAEPLVQAVVDELARLGANVQTGRFRTDMRVALVNDGPVTVMIEI